MFGRSPEEKKQAEAEKQQALEQAELERQRIAYENSPVGLAQSALRDGKRFFQVQLPISRLSGLESEYGSSDNSISSAGGDPELLARIEDLGWRLEHVGYVFIETGWTSTDRPLAGGEGTVTRGQVHGVYLFRNAGTVAAAQPVA